jgi:hypothetical protein
MKLSSLREIVSVADLVRHFEKMRAEGAFRPAVASEKRKS